MEGTSGTLSTPDTTVSDPEGGMWDKTLCGKRTCSRFWTKFRFFYCKFPENIEVAPPPPLKIPGSEDEIFLYARSTMGGGGGVGNGCRAIALSEVSRRYE